MASVEDAEKACNEANLVLATAYDAQTAFDTGDESCSCGWIADGSKLELVREPRADCSEGKKFGVQKCDGDKLSAICVTESA